MKKINFILDNELHKKIKILCAEQNISITQYLISLMLNDLKCKGIK